MAVVSSTSSRATALLAALLAVPALVIASSPSFQTQDGPSHLLGCRLLLLSLVARDHPLGALYEVAWRPVANWGGDVLTTLCLAALPDAWAARAVTLVTLVAIPAAVMMLRREVSVTTPAWSALLASLLGMNFAWIMGFASFELGAAAALATAASWWRSRSRGGSPVAAGSVLAAGLVVSHFCHLVAGASLVLVVLVAESVLVLHGRAGRGSWSLLGLAPAAPLMALHSWAVHGTGRFDVVAALESCSLADASRLPRAFLTIEPISIATRKVLPFVEARAAWHGLASPLVVASIALVVLAVEAARRDASAGVRAWLSVAVLLLFLGAFGPDTTGPGQGCYLTQRLALLGLCVFAASAPTPAAPSRRRLVTVSLAVAWSLQVAHVAGYSRECAVRVAAVEALARDLPADARIATILASVSRRHRSEPAANVGCPFGMEGRRVSLSFYEARLPYFHVHARPGAALAPPGPLGVIGEMAIGERPGDAATELRRYLDENGALVDAIVVVGAPSGELLDAAGDRFVVAAVDREALLLVDRGRSGRVRLAEGELPERPLPETP